MYYLKIRIYILENLAFRPPPFSGLTSHFGHGYPIPVSSGLLETGVNATSRAPQDARQAGQ